jgi:RimK family alpha-L-glutamate ligase
MEKQQVQQDKKPEPTKKSKGKPPAEKKARGVDLPNLEDTKFLSELSKMGAITPYALASQFNLRISVAKDMLEELERKAVIINPLMSLLRYSKEYLTLKAVADRYPHPRTFVTENIEKAFEFAAGLLDNGRDVVLKPICRARGTGVTLLSGIRRREDLMQFLTWYARSQGEGVFYLQEFIVNLGYDVRVFIVDNEVAGRMKRSNPQDFRYNASIGGLAEPFEDSVYDELAIRVAEANGLKITGVDVLPGKDGVPYILEANCYPGYAHLITATGIQVQNKIVDFFSRILFR